MNNLSIKIRNTFPNMIFFQCNETIKNDFLINIVVDHIRYIIHATIVVKEKEKKDAHSSYP